MRHMSELFAKWRAYLPIARTDQIVHDHERFASRGDDHGSVMGCLSRVELRSCYDAVHAQSKEKNSIEHR